MQGIWLNCSLLAKLAMAYPTQASKCILLASYAKVQNEADTRSVSWIYFSRSSTIWIVKFVFLRKLHFVGNMSWPFTSGEQERNIYLFAKIHLNQTIHCRPLLEPALIRCFVKVTRLSLVHLDSSNEVHAMFDTIKFLFEFLTQLKHDQHPNRALSKLLVSI